MTARAEHLAWCKTRALEVLATGDCAGAVASMIADVEKSEEPLYDEFTLAMMGADGTMHRNTPAQVRNWIEGFA